MSAQQAAGLARWRLVPPSLDIGLNYDGTARVELERDGFDVVVTVSPDFDYDPTDFLGTFTDDAHAEGAEINPRGWYIGRDGAEKHRDHYGYVMLAEGFRRSDLAAWAHSEGGMSRAVANDYAAEQVATSIRELTREESNAVTVTARVLRAGIELGLFAIGGLDLGDNDGDNERWIAEAAQDVISEAIDEAVNALARLCPNGKAQA